MRDHREQEKPGSRQDAQEAHQENEDGRFVICDYCDAELVLSDEELAQGWYRCPECDELSHLGELEDEAPDSSQSPGWEEPSHPDVSHRPAEKAECGYCHAVVSLSAREGTQGWFYCPVCHRLGQLDDYVTCLSCGSKLELDEEEWDQGWYRCPDCHRATQLIESAQEEVDPVAGSPAEEPPPEATAPDSADRSSDADWVQLKTAAGPEEAALEVAYLRVNDVEAFTWQEGAGHAFGLTVGLLGSSHVMVREDQLQLARSLLDVEAEDQAYVVQCTQCGTWLELSDQEVAEGHFICPECLQLIQLSDYVTCPVCQTQLALDDAERLQGWYRCPECDQVTHL